MPEEKLYPVSQARQVPFELRASVHTLAEGEMV